MGNPEMEKLEKTYDQGSVHCEIMCFIFYFSPIYYFMEWSFMWDHQTAVGKGTPLILSSWAKGAAPWDTPVEGRLKSLVVYFTAIHLKEFQD